jgi:hypothetical protein
VAIHVNEHVLSLSLKITQLFAVAFSMAAGFVTSAAISYGERLSSFYFSSLSVCKKHMANSCQEASPVGNFHSLPMHVFDSIRCRKQNRDEDGGARIANRTEDRFDKSAATLSLKNP